MQMYLNLVSEFRLFERIIEYIFDFFEIFFVGDCIFAGSVVAWFLACSFRINILMQISVLRYFQRITLFSKIWLFSAKQYIDLDQFLKYIVECPSKMLDCVWDEDRKNKLTTKTFISFPIFKKCIHCILVCIPQEIGCL